MKPRPSSYVLGSLGGPVAAMAQPSNVLCGRRRMVLLALIDNNYLIASALHFQIRNQHLRKCFCRMDF